MTGRIAWAAPIAALLFAGCSENAAKEAETTYAVLTVETSDVSGIDKYPAAIKGQQDVEIYPQVSGRITAVKVKEGQHVSHGQTLFVIDQVPYRAALQAAKADESAARANVATARLNFEGKKELYESQVTSLFEVQKAKNALLSAEAALEQAEAKATEAKNNLSYTTVTSPCDGIVGTLPYRTGALVSPSITQPLTTVSDNEKMHVYFSVPENQMLAWARKYGSTNKALASLPKVQLYTNDGSLYEQEGRIESVSGVLDAETGSLSLRAVFPNDNRLLHSGGAGNIGLKVERKNVLTVPQSATYELQDKVYVYRYVNGKAVATRINATSVGEQRICIVESGLKAGDIIVAEGVSMLQDGTPIKPKRGNKQP